MLSGGLQRYWNKCCPIYPRICWIDNRLPDATVSADWHGMRPVFKTHKLLRLRVSSKYGSQKVGQLVMGGVTLLTIQASGIAIRT